MEIMTLLSWVPFTGSLHFGLTLSLGAHAGTQIAGWMVVGWVSCFVPHTAILVLVAGAPSPRAAVLANGDHEARGNATAGKGPGLPAQRTPASAPRGG